MNKYILWRQAMVIADGRQDDQNGDEKWQPSWWTSVCRELNSRTSKAAAADSGTHASTLKTMWAAYSNGILTIDFSIL